MRVQYRSCWTFEVITVVFSRPIHTDGIRASTIVLTWQSYMAYEKSRLEQRKANSKLKWDYTEAPAFKESSKSVHQVETSEVINMKSSRNKTLLLL